MMRLLALDLDGTLLDARGQVDACDRQAIFGLRERGVIVTIITGRLSAGALEAARVCGITGAIGCCDGSHLYDVGRGATLAHHALTAETLRGLDDLLGEAEIARYVFSTSHVFCEDAGHRFADYVRTWSPQLAQLENLTHRAPVWDEHAPLAQLVIGPAERIARALEAVRRTLPELFAVTFPVAHEPSSHALLLRAGGPTKGTALIELCRHYGVAPSEAVAVGDWINDVPMFLAAGRSFAMAVAPPEVKSVATDALPEGASSIAEAIRRVWG